MVYNQHYLREMENQMCCFLLFFFFAVAHRKVEHAGAKW